MGTGVGWELCISALVVTQPFPRHSEIPARPQQQIKPLSLALRSLSLLVPAEEALCSPLLAWFINPSTKKWIKSILCSPVSDEQGCLSHHRLIKVGKNLNDHQAQPLTQHCQVHQDLDDGLQPTAQFRFERLSPAGFPQCLRFLSSPLGSATCSIT